MKFKMAWWHNIHSRRSQKTDVFQKVAGEIKVYLTFYLIKNSQLREDLNLNERKRT